MSRSAPSFGGLDFPALIVQVELRRHIVVMPLPDLTGIVTKLKLRIALLYTR